MLVMNSVMDVTLEENDSCRLPGSRGLRESPGSVSVETLLCYSPVVRCLRVLLTQ